MKAISRSVRKHLWILIILIPVFLYLPGIFGKIPYPSEAARYSDFSISHYPYALYIQNTVREVRQIPLWADFLYSGIPLAANPLASLWYPPQWLALLLPLPAGLSLMAALHCGLGGLGVYRLLLQEGIRGQGALLAGMIFGLMPKIYAHYGAGHLTLVYALAWTPWLLKVVRSRGPFIKSGLILGMIFLADPRWAPYAGLVWLMYVIAHRQEGFFETTAKIFGAGITSAAISAPLLLPFLQFVSGSTRLRMDSAELLTGSLKPVGFFGLIMPAWGSNHEMFCYIGAGGLIAVIVAVGGMQKERNSFFWPIVFFLSCFIALGENLPGSDMISVIPLISLGRIPARAMFLAGLASSVMIGMLFEGLQQGSVKFKIINYLGFGFIVFGATVLGYGSYQGSKILQNTWWSAIIFCGVGGALFAVRHQRYRKAALIVLFFLINIDYIYSNIASIDWRYEPQDRIGRAIADLGSGVYRIYSPSFSLTQISAVKNGLEITDGVDPMQLESYQEFMETASGVPYQKYSVSIPPFGSGEPDQDNAGYKPDPEQLGLLNVKYLVSNFPLEDPELKFVREIEGEYIYENKQFKPRAWVEGQKNEIKPADVLLNSPNRIEIFGTGPGNLVISEIDYPGWRVIVNGEEREIKEIYRLLRSVAMDPGSNRITFIYRPGLVFIGLMISGLGVVFVFWQMLRSKRE